MAKPKQQPTFIVMPDGSRYRLVVMRVEGTYEDRPRIAGMEVPAELTFVDDDDVCEISEGCRFVTAYVPESVFGKQPPLKHKRTP